ncbi:MAG: hypothetical protein ABIE43_04445 [Patescibacteria group bacterium]
MKKLVFVVLMALAVLAVTSLALARDLGNNNWEVVDRNYLNKGIKLVKWDGNLSKMPDYKARGKWNYDPKIGGGNWVLVVAYTTQKPLAGDPVILYIDEIKDKKPLSPGGPYEDALGKNF